LTTANAIFFVGLIILAVGLMVGAYHFRKPALSLGAVAGWLLIALFGFTQSAITWDIYYGLGWFSIGLAIVSALEALGIREKPESMVEKDDLDEYIEEQEEYDKKDSRFRRAIMPARARRRRLVRSKKAEKKASDDFANTGRIG